MEGLGDRHIALEARVQAAEDLWRRGDWAVRSKLIRRSSPDGWPNSMKPVARRVRWRRPISSSLAASPILQSPSDTCVPRTTCSPPWRRSVNR